MKDKATCRRSASPSRSVRKTARDSVMDTQNLPYRCECKRFLTIKARRMGSVMVWSGRCKTHGLRWQTENGKPVNINTKEVRKTMTNAPKHP